MKHVLWESHKWQRRPILSPDAWNDDSEVTCKPCFKLGDLREIKRLFCLGNKGFGQLFSAAFKFLKLLGFKSQSSYRPSPSLPLSSWLGCSLLPPISSYRFLHTKPLLPQSLHTFSSLPWMLWPPLNTFLDFSLPRVCAQISPPQRGLTYINICKITHMLKRRETSHTAVLILCRDDE